MKEIVTGSCLLAVSVLMAVLFCAHVSGEHSVDKKPAAMIFGVCLFTIAIAFGFSGCGIFIRGVIR